MTSRTPDDPQSGWRDPAVAERIGAYRLVRLLGTGGMGDVYEAVRDDDQYHARVAIKLMRGDVRNPLVEQRFRTERQILARLDHRNIARLLDGGTTAAGLPYVVMELVVGEPIDRYCDSHPQSTRERVQLFLQVCAAVSFAHQQLVVHRDLKPANIFVTAEGSVKLLDFGIAKLLESEPATGPSSEETRTQFRAMTLEYASPEQLGGRLVTTASDVYSLGVVLHRLLTGRSPYRATGGDAARAAEILGDTVPLRPGLDEDLDNILLMALRKDPATRYGSVEQLTADLRRYLAGLPVSARGDSFTYRARKFARRHRVSIAAAALVVVSLIGGVGVALREKHLAEEQRAIAQRHFDSVRKLATKLFEFHDEIAALPGATPARQMLLNTSLEYLDALYQQSGADRSLQIEVADAYRRVGEIQGSPYSGNVGDTKGALESYRKSIALLEDVHAADDHDAHATQLLVDTLAAQTTLLTLGLGQPAAASARRAVELAEEVAPTIPDDHDRMKFLARAYWALATATAQAGGTPEGFAAIDRMVALADAYVAKHADDPRGLVAIGDTYGNAAVFLTSRLPKEEAGTRVIDLMKKSLTASQKRLAMQPDDAGVREGVANGQYNLADILLGAGRYAEALANFDAAMPELAARAANQKDTHARLTLLMNQSGRAWALYKLGRLVEAGEAMRANERDLTSLAASYDNVQATYVLARARVRLAQWLLSRSLEADARPLLLAGRDGLRAVYAVFKLEGDEREPLDTAERLLAQMRGVSK